MNTNCYYTVWYSSEQGLLLVPFARTSTGQNRAFSVVDLEWPPLGASPPPRTLSLAFFSHLKAVILALLELGALPNSFLEAALYKCSLRMNCRNLCSSCCKCEAFVNRVFGGPTFIFRI